MKYIRVSLLFLTLFVIGIGCAEQPKEKGILYPNNDSELTLLMREMYNYYDSLKIDIQNGDVPNEIRQFAEIHTSVATEPSKSESPLFKAMADVYLESERKLRATGGDKRKAFNFMIDNCMNCHQQMCPGPMVKIKKLYVKGEY